MATLENRGIIKTAQYHASLAEIPIPALRPEYILVHTIAVALNPTDWQAVDEALKDGTPYTLLGCDVGRGPLGECLLSCFLTCFVRESVSSNC
jgi:hypothetical protein